MSVRLLKMEKTNMPIEREYIAAIDRFAENIFGLGGSLVTQGNRQV